MCYRKRVVENCMFSGSYQQSCLWLVGSCKSAVTWALGFF